MFRLKYIQPSSGWLRKPNGKKNILRYVGLWSET